MLAAAGSLAADRAGHVVRFYDHDDELARRVGGDLAEALADGGVAVVVATGAHRDAIEARLSAAGCDVAEAGSSGRYLGLDAAATMDQFLVGDRPDPAAFEQVIGGVIRRAAAAGQPVRVFGEMVALLWSAGLVGAAIEVEALWNELATLAPFWLTCGYPAASVHGAGHAKALETVCGLHTAVTGHLPTGTVTGPARCTSRAIALSGTAPREARRFVTSALGQWGDLELAADAEVIVGELAANAFVHARSGFTVTVSRMAHSVRIAVRDNGATADSAQGCGLVADPGHGLGVVAAVSSRWAAEQLPAGTTVWAELDRPGAPGVTAGVRSPGGPVCRAQR